MGRRTSSNDPYGTNRMDNQMSHHSLFHRHVTASASPAARSNHASAAYYRSSSRRREERGDAGQLKRVALLDSAEPLAICRSTKSCQKFYFGWPGGLGPLAASFWGFFVVEGWGEGGARCGELRGAADLMCGRRQSLFPPFLVESLDMDTFKRFPIRIYRESIFFPCSFYFNSHRFVLGSSILPKHGIWKTQVVGFVFPTLKFHRKPSTLHLGEILANFRCRSNAHEKFQAKEKN